MFVLLLVLPIALVIAMLRGGKLSRLASLPLRWPALPLLALAVQLIVIYFPARSQAMWVVHIGLLLLSYGALFAAVWVNRRLPGMILLCAGLVLNLTVMMANGGYMPTTRENVARHGHQVVDSAMGTRVAQSKDVVLSRDDTRLWFLGDVIVLSRPLPVTASLSPGDILLMLGVFWLVQHALLSPSAAEPKVALAPLASSGVARDAS
jgi:hypothetical protein